MSVEAIGSSPHTDTSDADAISASIQPLLDKQRAAYLADGPPDAATRIDRLDRAIGLIVDYQDEIVEALKHDFGHRSEIASLLTDVNGSLGPLKFAKKNLRRWMRSEKRKPMFPLGLLGAKAEIRYQPLGVVGVISPWNFPVNLTFSPLAGILAAGNRVMIKPSEFTPETSDLMARMFASAFDESEIAVVTGGPEVGQAFSGMAFDHLLFTGATNIARHVMHAAAENLVPVTLELGGKSPVVVGRSAKIEDTARKIMTGKMMNAGQICLAPDYIFVAKEQRDALVTALEKVTTEMFASLEKNDDYTSVINARHAERLAGLLDDARSHGAKVVEINPANEDFSSPGHHKMAPAIVVDPSDDSRIMTSEIFGPLLPVKSYSDIGEVIDYVNARPRPLALYYFGHDSNEQEQILTRTTSGGVTINDVIMHVSMEEIPFGGVGDSGMGAYHGREGFRTFSHAKSIFTQGRIDIGKMMRPPYGEKTLAFVKKQIKR